MNAIASIVPDSIAAEQALIGACLLNPEVMDLIAGDVTARDFAEPLHVLIFDAFERARDEGRRISVGLVTALLGDQARIPVAGMTAGQYIARLAAEATTVINAPDFAKLVAEAAAYRRLAVVGQELHDRALSGHPGGLPRELAAEAIAALDPLSHVGIRQTPRVSVGEAAAEAWQAAEDMATNGVVRGTSWGLTDLDRMTELYPGELTIVAARPSMGKTTVALGTALSVAKGGEGVLFFSLEMNRLAVGQRVLSDLCFDGYRTPIPYTDIRHGRFPSDGAERLKEAAEYAAGLPLLIEDQAGLTASQIVAKAKSGRKIIERQGRELGLIVVDHLGLIAASDRYAGSRHLELGATTTALREMAKELDVPVVLLCQLSRGVEGRDNKRPQLSDLRESGRIEEDADAVLMLYREAYYLERMKETDPDKDATRIARLAAVRDSIEIIVAKQRMGATGTVTAYVSMPSNAVRNAARNYGGMA